MSETVYDACKAFLELDATKSLLADPDGAHAVPPIRFENATFDAPKDLRAWLSMTVTSALYAQESIGMDEQADNRWDEGGKLIFAVFVKVGTGGKRSHSLAHQVADLFRGRVLMDGSLEFMESFIGQGGPSEPEEGQWYQRNVVIDWRRTDA